MKMDEPEPCEHCDGEGWIDDPLSSACGGRWFRYCECPAGIMADKYYAAHNPGGDSLYSETATQWAPLPEAPPET
jgi:hypothetical protein